MGTRRIKKEMKQRGKNMNKAETAARTEPLPPE